MGGRYVKLDSFLETGGSHDNSVEKKKKTMKKYSMYAGKKQKYVVFTPHTREFEARQ